MTVDNARRARGERRRLKTRTALLDAAERLLSDRSTDAVRMEDVAELAGISPASLYLHFGTKDALVSAVIERLLDTSMETMTTAFTREGTAADRVAEAGVAYMRLLLEHPALTRYLSVSMLGGPDSPIDEKVSERIDLLRSAFEALIQSALDEGEIRPADSRLLSFFLFGAWNGVAALALRQDKVRLTTDEVEECLLQAREALIRGIALSPDTHLN